MTQEYTEECANAVNNVQNLKNTKRIHKDDFKKANDKIICTDINVHNKQPKPAVPGSLTIA